MKKRCVLVGAAPIENVEKIKSLLTPDDYFIFCDGGLFHEKKLGVSPDLIVGDFDSHKRPERQTETIVLPCEKDDTDTFFAAKEGIKRGFKEFLLIGCAGKRLDHTLANTSALIMLFNLGLKAVLADDYSEMEIVGEKEVAVSDAFSYFSLLNISGEAKCVNVKNAKYPLLNAEIKCDYPYAVSNEVLKGKCASVSVGKGKLLLIKVY